MELIMRKNGFCKGVELKRKPTEEEMIYCLNEILGFDYGFIMEDLNLELESAECEEEAESIKEEIEREKKDIHKAFVGFIKGDVDWYGLCDAMYVYDDVENFYLGNFAHMLAYLEEKGII